MARRPEKPWLKLATPVYDDGAQSEQDLPRPKTWRERLEERARRRPDSNTPPPDLPPRAA
jgi:hypothetical protein